MFREPSRLGHRPTACVSSRPPSLCPAASPLLLMQEVGGPAASDSRPLSAHDASCGPRSLDPRRQDTRSSVTHREPALGTPRPMPPDSCKRELLPSAQPTPGWQGHSEPPVPGPPTGISPSFSLSLPPPSTTRRAEVPPPLCAPPFPVPIARKVGSQGCRAHGADHELWPQACSLPQALLSPSPEKHHQHQLSWCRPPAPGWQPTFLLWSVWALFLREVFWTNAYTSPILGPPRGCPHSTELVSDLYWAPRPPAAGTQTLLLVGRPLLPHPSAPLAQGAWGHRAGQDRNWSGGGMEQIGQREAHLGLHAQGTRWARCKC